MRSHAGVATQLFESLARQGVKALLISTSEIKIAVLVPEDALESCVKCLHNDLRLVVRVAVLGVMRLAPVTDTGLQVVRFRTAVRPHSRGSELR